MPHQLLLILRLFSMVPCNRAIRHVTRLVKADTVTKGDNVKTTKKAVKQKTGTRNDIWKRSEQSKHAAALIGCYPARNGFVYLSASD